jgi:VanZ family protein
MTEPATSPVADKSDVWMFRRKIAVLWTLAIVTMCWLPGEFLQSVEVESFLWKMPNLDKFIHWGMFTTFSVVWLRVGNSRLRFVAVAFAGFTLAALTEIVQALPVIGRQAEMADFLTDLFGLLAGIVAGRFVEPLVRLLELHLAPWMVTSPINERRDVTF